MKQRAQNNNRPRHLSDRKRSREPADVQRGRATTGGKSDSWAVGNAAVRQLLGPDAKPLSASIVPPIVYEVLRLAGQPLDPAVRSFMEASFRHDFGQVRVHTDALADASARLLDAAAYTVGQNIVFGSGQYQPGNQEGRQLLAHELAHTLQQRSNPPEYSRNVDIAESKDGSEEEAQCLGPTVAFAFPERSSEPVNDSHVSVRTSSEHGLQRSSHVGRGQNAPAAPPGQQPGPRLVLIDANVIGEINRGNVAAAEALLRLQRSGQVYLSRQAYAELTHQPGRLRVNDQPAERRYVGTGPPLARMAAANRELLSDLHLTVRPNVGTVSQRGDTLGRVETQMAGNISVSDRQHLAEARLLGAEFWTLERPLGSQRQAIERHLGVRLAPESDLAIVGNARTEDYRVARRILGLGPIRVTAGGRVIRGTPGPGTGGAVGGGPARPGQASSAPTHASGQAAQGVSGQATPALTGAPGQGAPSLPRRIGSALESQPVPTQTPQTTTPQRVPVDVPEQRSAPTPRLLSIRESTVLRRLLLNLDSETRWLHRTVTGIRGALAILNTINTIVTIARTSLGREDLETMDSRLRHPVPRLSREAQEAREWAEALDDRISLLDAWTFVNNAIERYDEDTLAQIYHQLTALRAELFGPSIDLEDAAEATRRSENAARDLIGTARTIILHGELEADPTGAGTALRLNAADIYINLFTLPEALHGAALNYDFAAGILRGKTMYLDAITDRASNELWRLALWRIGVLGTLLGAGRSPEQ